MDNQLSKPRELPGDLRKTRLAQLLVFLCVIGAIGFAYWKVSLEPKTIIKNRREQEIQNFFQLIDEQKAFLEDNALEEVEYEFSLVGNKEFLQQEIRTILKDVGTQKYSEKPGSYRVRDDSSVQFASRGRLECVGHLSGGIQENPS